MERSILLVGGDRRQTHLAGLLEHLGPVRTLSVPGLPDTAVPEPAGLLVLPCPTRDPAGRIRRAGEGLDPDCLLPFLDRETRIFCGAPGPLGKALAEEVGAVTDLLEDPVVLAENARLTAEAALLLAGTETGTSLRGQSCAVLGWGRIAKCLAALLRANGAEVLVCARRPEALAEAAALGFPVCLLRDYETRESLIFNTVPAAVLPRERLTGGLWVELASAPGGLPDPPPLPMLNGSGLPGRLLPRSAAEVLYRGILRNLR